MVEMRDLLSQYESEMDSVTCDHPECTRRATHIVTCHQIDHCRDKGAARNGNKSFLFCAECAKDVGDIIADRVQAMRRAVAQQENTKLECRACHMEITHLSKVLNVEHLVPTVFSGE